jgi:hypothetical protein
MRYRRFHEIPFGDDAKIGSVQRYWLGPRRGGRQERGREWLAFYVLSRRTPTLPSFPPVFQCLSQYLDSHDRFCLPSKARAWAIAPDSSSRQAIKLRCSLELVRDLVPLTDRAICEVSTFLDGQDVTPSPQKGQKKPSTDVLFMAEPDRAHRGTASGSDWDPPRRPGGGQRRSRGAYCTQAYGVRKSES